MRILFIPKKYDKILIILIYLIYSGYNLILERIIISHCQFISNLALIFIYFGKHFFVYQTLLRCFQGHDCNLNIYMIMQSKVFLPIDVI